jgi:hypothetical protein
LIAVVFFVYFFSLLFFIILPVVSCQWEARKHCWMGWSSKSGR